MSKCLNCNIEILDSSQRCPLCHGVLKQEGSTGSMYPDVRVPTRRLALAVRIFLFCAIVLETGLVAVNIALGHQLLWSVLTGLALLYCYLVLRYAVLGTGGYQGKTFVLTLMAVLLAVAADFATGYRGWSVDYVLPCGIIFIDICVFVLIFVNRRNWQCYIIWEIFMLLCSIIPATLYLKGLEHNACFAFLPLALSAYLFLGSIIIGGRRARLELKRRFHF